MKVFEAKKKIRHSYELWKFYTYLGNKQVAFRYIHFEESLVFGIASSSILEEEDHILESFVNVSDSSLEIAPGVNIHELDFEDGSKRQTLHEIIREVVPANIFVRYHVEEIGKVTLSFSRFDFLEVENSEKRVDPRHFERFVFGVTEDVYGQMDRRQLNSIVRRYRAAYEERLPLTPYEFEYASLFRRNKWRIV